jgi:ATP-binding cassette, subfamily C, bacterial exporter for protease/lipase
MSTAQLKGPAMASHSAAADVGGKAKAGFISGGELGRVIWTFRRELAWVFVFSCFANLLMLTPTLYMLQVFDRVMLSGSELTLVALTGIAVVFFLVMGFSEWVRSRLLVRAGARLDEALSTRVFNSTYEARLSGQARQPMQPLVDLTQLRQFLSGTGTIALVDTPWAAIYIAVLFLMHPMLGWASIAFCVVQIALALIGHQLTARRYEKTQEFSLESGTYVQTKLRNAETVEALGMLGNLRRQWLDVHEKHMASSADGAEITRRVQAVTKFVQYTQQSLILAVGAVLAVDGQISAGAMIACNALMGNALRPIGTMVQVWRQYVDAKVAYRRIDALLTENPERNAPIQGGEVKGQVSLRNMEASAAGGKVSILKGLTVDFNAGEVVAILGPSGAGKSTLARCLLGIWPERQGQVLLDGQPIESWSRTALGPHVGYLPQDIELFDGSIAENIARFAQVEPEVVIDAATRTGIHEMILRLPKGYDTPMGEAGGFLSGGQRQRIGLARAILGDPTLVVLDEPNANLDDAGEAALVRTVRELKSRGKTVFMIVHQQHLLAAADRVLILQNGLISKFLPVVAPGAAAPQSSQP